MLRKYKCYVVYQKGSIPHPVGKKRRGKIVWIDSPSRDEAEHIMNVRHTKPRKKEHVHNIVIAPWKEDRALREIGAKELPLNWN